MFNRRENPTFLVPSLYFWFISTLIQHFYSLCSAREKYAKKKLLCCTAFSNIFLAVCSREKCVLKPLCLQHFFSCVQQGKICSKTVVSPTFFSCVQQGKYVLKPLCLQHFFARKAGIYVQNPLLYSSFLLALMLYREKESNCISLFLYLHWVLWIGKIRSLPGQCVSQVLR